MTDALTWSVPALIDYDRHGSPGRSHARRTISEIYFIYNSVSEYFMFDGHLQSIAKASHLAVVGILLQFRFILIIKLGCSFEHP